MTTLLPPGESDAAADAVDVGFADQVALAAEREAEAVVADLARVRFRADQVLRVLNALNLPVPPALADFLGFSAVEDHIVTGIGGGMGAPSPTPAEATETSPPDRVAPKPPSPSAPSPHPRGEPKSTGATATEPTDVEQTSVGDVAISPGFSEPPPKAPSGSSAAPSGAGQYRDTGKVRSDGRRMPEPPGIEAVPERLRAMPAGQKTGPLKQRIKAAEQQLAVYRDVIARPNVIPGEIAKRVDQPQSRVADYLRELEAAGLIRRTGVNRHAFDRKPGLPGRASVEYAPLKAPASPPPGSSDVRTRPATPGAHAIEQGDTNRAKVRDWVLKHGPAKLSSIVDGVGLAQTVVSRHLKSLVESGILVKTGQMRNARYGAASEPTAEPATAPVTVPQVESDNLQELVNQVRTALVRHAGDELTIGQVAELAGVGRIAAIAVVQQLVANGSVKKKRPPGTKEDVFTYTKPGDAGAGAKHDAASRPVERPSDRSPSGPIAGTGRGPKAANKDVQQLLDAAIAAGATNVQQSGGHWSVTGPNGRVLIPSTPGSARSLMTARARLRTNAGLDI